MRTIRTPPDPSDLLSVGYKPYRRHIYVLLPYEIHTEITHLSNVKGKKFSEVFRELLVYGMQNYEEETNYDDYIYIS